MDVSRLDRPVTCATMPRSFLIKKKNYSHCPLKKRPVHDFMIKAEDDDNSEPENLSTKPEDLSLSAAAASTVHCPKPLTPPAGVALISAAAAHGVAKAPTSTPPPTTPTVIVPQPTSAAVAAHHFLASKGGPLEPLSLNTAAPTPAAPSVDYLQPWHYHHHQPPPPPYMGWYPPHADHPALFHHHHPHYPAPPSAFSRHTPHHNHHHEPMSVSPPPAPPPHVFSPVAVVAASTPKLFLPYATPAGLSPTSSSGSFQQPPSPEDLSSPGSVSSASSGGSSGNGGGKKIRTPKDGSSQSGVGGRYQCPDCSKSYSTYSGLAKHRQFHCAAAGGLQATKKSFSCKFCEKVYVSLGALKMHIRTHTLPCKCTLCGKAFSRPWLLQGHIRTHTGEKPFSCPHCSRAFADRSNLRAHLQTHSDVKKYSCALCGKTFSRMSLLSKHADSGCPATPGGGNGLSGDQSTPPPQSPSDDSIYH